MSRGRHIAVIKATKGNPFRISRWSRDLYALRRVDGTGRTNQMVMSESDVIALTNTLIDCIERGD